VGYDDFVFPLINLSVYNDDDEEEKTSDKSDFGDEAYYAALGTRPPINMEELNNYRKSYNSSLCAQMKIMKIIFVLYIVEALELGDQCSYF
jgi:PDZ-binding kinase